MASRVVPDASCLTDQLETLFREDSILQEHLHASLSRMLRFYGLKLEDEKLMPADNWAARKLNWFVQDTQNYLRITRILHCLQGYGLESEARNIYAGLEDLASKEKDCGLSQAAMEYWHQAVK